MKVGDKGKLYSRCVSRKSVGCQMENRVEIWVFKVELMVEKCVRILMKDEGDSESRMKEVNLKWVKGVDSEGEWERGDE